MLEKNKTDADVLVPENEGKKYKITVTEQKGGDYIKRMTNIFKFKRVKEITQ